MTSLDLDLVIERTGHTRFRDLVRDRPEYQAVVADMARTFRGQPAPPKPPGDIRPDGIAPAIVVRSYASSWTGYGQIGEWLGRGLESHGESVGYCPLRTNEEYHPAQTFVTGRRVGPPPRGARVLQLATPHTEPLDLPTVAFTMWESSQIKPTAVEYLNRVAAVVVPCRWNAECFKACGVMTPIHVVPLGVSVNEGYAATSRARRHGEVITFGMAARMAHGGIRKGLNEGMAAFVKAFPDGTSYRLSVKVFEDCLPALSVPNDPRITIITEPYLPPQMAEWYRSIDVLLVPSKGEGFGLHTLQAMAVGIPVIAARQTGTAEFWTPDCGWELSGRWEPAGEFYAGQGDWFVPSEASMVQAMRQAVTQHSLASRGEAAAKRAAEFPWSRTGEGLYRVLAGLGWVKPTNGHVQARPGTARQAIACDHRIIGRVGCCSTYICRLHGGRHAPVEICEECPDRTDA